MQQRKQQQQQQKQQQQQQNLQPGHRRLFVDCTEQHKPEHRSNARKCDHRCLHAW
jgi:hypothetical protein